MQPLAERLWYALWDGGVRLDHSVRTVAQAVAVAGADLPAALGLLDARYVAGDAGLGRELVAAVRGEPGHAGTGPRQPLIRAGGDAPCTRGL